MAASFSKWVTAFQSVETCSGLCCGIWQLSLVLLVPAIVQIDVLHLVVGGQHLWRFTALFEVLTSSNNDVNVSGRLKLFDRFVSQTMFFSDDSLKPLTEC